jgi:acetoin utilization protein AcuB
MMPPTTIAAGASIQEAARVMLEHNSECLLVMDGDQLVGLLTRTDLLRELARSQEP